MKKLFIYVVFILGVSSMAAQVKTASPKRALKLTIKNKTMLAIQKKAPSNVIFSKRIITVIRREA